MRKVVFEADEAKIFDRLSEGHLTREKLGAVLIGALLTGETALDEDVYLELWGIRLVEERK